MGLKGCHKSSRLDSCCAVQFHFWGISFALPPALLLCFGSILESVWSNFFKDSRSFLRWRGFLDRLFCCGGYVLVARVGGRNL